MGSQIQAFLNDLTQRGLDQFEKWKTKAVTTSDLPDYLAKNQV